MAATLSYSLLAGPAFPGVSTAAQFINDQVEAGWLALQRSRALGNIDLYDDLAELAVECAEPDWDGYGAVAVSAETLQEAQRFLRSLPASKVRPTLGAEPDGHVTCEWHISPRRTLSVSISPDGTLHYSATIGASRSFGTEPFLGECPPAILDLVQRIRLA